MSKLWLFDSDLRFNQTNPFIGLSSATDMIFWRNNISFIFSNGQWFEFIDYSYKPWFLRYSKERKSVKVTEFNDLFHHFESQLNGHPITAATDIRLNDTTFVYLFAGRMLCRQELSEKFVKVCDIEDIADWIDCTEDTSHTSDILHTSDTTDTSGVSDDSNTLLIVLVVVGIFVVLLIIVIIVSVWLIFSNGRPKSETDPKATSKSSVNAVRSDLKSTDVKV